LSSDRSQADTAPKNSETLAGTPISCLELLGCSVLQRTIKRLAQGGVTAFTILTEAGLAPINLRPTPGWPKQTIEIYSLNSPSDVWPLVRRTIHSFADKGVDNIVLMKLGAYVEFDPGDAIEFFKAADQAAIRVWDRQGALDLWLLNARHLSENGNMLEQLQSLLQESSLKTYPLSGYVNRLLGTADLRQLVMDIFHSHCEAKPEGVERRPGVWIDEEAIVHRQARIVPPAYIGKNTRIGAASLITRSSNIERDCYVDYGTAIENSSVLAGTYIGAGLDITHSVVYMNKLVHLYENVILEINDEILIGANQASPFRRAFRRNSKDSILASSNLQMTAPN
jgi:carbonic anhydrase/acetyltransferase-like protein (isoleucine patch superfamily)